ncbi:MAG: hypothetical protein QM235_02345, partial [Pseudomonadota bacterium]|nr:hypothetical protein [Pseudomonadota bacterium]
RNSNLGFLIEYKRKHATAVRTEEVIEKIISSPRSCIPQQNRTLKKSNKHASNEFLAISSV